MKVPALKDAIQEVGGNLEIPEIRVWCHPHYIDKDGDDYYYTFKSFKYALTFIAKHREAEDQPLIAFRGYELNIFGMEAEPFKGFPKPLPKEKK